MKIAFYSPSWPAANAQNGIATYVDVMTRALAMGCPVVTTATYGPREFLTEGEDLLVADIGDAGGLAVRAASLLDDPQKAAAMAAAGCKAVLAHFAPDAVVKRYVAFCEDVPNGAFADAGKGA